MMSDKHRMRAREPAFWDQGCPTGKPAAGPGQQTLLLMKEGLQSEPNGLPISAADPIHLDRTVTPEGDKPASKLWSMDARFLMRAGTFISSYAKRTSTVAGAEPAIEPGVIVGQGATPQAASSSSEQPKPSTAAATAATSVEEEQPSSIAFPTQAESEGEAERAPELEEDHVDEPKEEEDWPTFLSGKYRLGPPAELASRDMGWVLVGCDYFGGEDPKRTAIGEVQSIKAAVAWIVQLARMVAGGIGVTITSALRQNPR